MEKTSFRSRSYNQKSKTKNSCTRELLVCKFQALTISRRFDTFDVAVPGEVYLRRVPVEQK